MTPTFAILTFLVVLAIVLAGAGWFVWTITHND
jgi:hypothetical protein